MPLGEAEQASTVQPPSAVVAAALGRSATLTVSVHSREPGDVELASLTVKVPEGAAATDASLTPIEVTVSAAGVNVDEATGEVVSAVLAVSELRNALVPVVSITDHVPVESIFPDAVEISVAAWANDGTRSATATRI